MLATSLSALVPVNFPLNQMILYQYATTQPDLKHFDFESSCESKVEGLLCRSIAKWRMQILHMFWGTHPCKHLRQWEPTLTQANM